MRLEKINKYYSDIQRKFSPVKDDYYADFTIYLLLKIDAKRKSRTGTKEKRHLEDNAWKKPITGLNLIIDIDKSYYSSQFLRISNIQYNYSAIVKNLAKSSKALSNNYKERQILWIL